MRVSGVVLVALIFGHLITNLVLGEGIHQIDFAFVAGKLASPFWQIWDLLLLWLALIHGTLGMKTIIHDYVHSRIIKKILTLLIMGATIILIILGTLVIFTFDPCPAQVPLKDLPSFCTPSSLLLHDFWIFL